MSRSSSRGTPGPSLAICLAAFYYLFIFVIWPLAYVTPDPDDLTSRIPLFIAIGMIGAALMAAQPIRNKAVSIVFGSFAFMYLLSSVGATGGVLEGITELLRHWGLGVCIFLAARSEKDCRFFIVVMAITSVISALYGMVFWAPGMGGLAATLISYGLPNGMVSGVTRMIGTMSDPSYFGLLILPGLAFALHKVLSPGSRVKVAYALPLLIVFAALFLSFSRTAWVAAAICVIVLVGRTPAKIMQFAVPVLAILGVVFLLGWDEIFLASISENEGRATLSLENQVDSRSWIWRAYLDLAIEEPLGYGQGGIEKLRYFATSGYEQYSTARPHNIYLIIWIERGIQTLLPFLVLLALAIATQLRLLKTSVRLRPLSVQVFAGLTALAVGAFSLGGQTQILSAYLGLTFALERMATATALRHGRGLP
jgi:O-antigen ligase